MENKIKKQQKYLSEEIMDSMTPGVMSVINIRNELYSQTGVDILSNDIISSIQMREIIKKYDPEYQPNFHRNGEDGVSGGILVERKCSNVEPKKNDVWY